MLSKKTGNKKKIVIITITTVLIVGVGSIVWADMAKKKEAKELAKLQEMQRLQQIEREKNEPIIGAKKDSVKKYGYDASIIWDKLDSYDYSNNGEKIVFLTFDDGPSTTNTPKVLDMLNKYDVKGTFFIKGNSLKVNGANDILKRTFDEGNAIAHHSYTHEYKSLYPNGNLNLNTFINEIDETTTAMKSVLGDKFSSNVLRCPGGFMSWKNMQPLEDYLKENDMSSIDWNALNADSEGKKKNAQELYEYAINTSKDKELVVLLMHDTYGKEETVKALDMIIPYYKENGYAFKLLI
ncbi:MAG: polysaccharide deacetylase family protein [Romboutsia sp.]